MRSPRTATKSSPRSPQLEKACTQQRRPNAAKNKNKINKILMNYKKKNYHSIVPGGFTKSKTKPCHFMLTCEVLS